MEAAHHAHHPPEGGNDARRMIDELARRHFLKLAVAAAGASALPALAAEDGGLTAVAGAPAEGALKVLRSLPAATEGSGPAIWILSSSLCRYCQQMNRERPGPVPGIAVNYVAYPLADRESGAVARVWRARSTDAYRRFMGGEFRDVPAVPVNPPRARSPHYATPDERLTDAQLFEKWYAEIRIVQSLWADDAGRIGTVTPESFIAVTLDSGPALIRLPGDGVPVLQAMIAKFPHFFPRG